MSDADDVIEIPAASVEVLAATVADNGTPVTDYELAVVPSGQQPTGWSAPVPAGDVLGPKIQGLPLGIAHAVFARYGDGNPEKPVILLGHVRMI